MKKLKAKTIERVSFKAKDFQNNNDNNCNADQYNAATNQLVSHDSFLKISNQFLGSLGQRISILDLVLNFLKARDLVLSLNIYFFHQVFSLVQFFDAIIESFIRFINSIINVIDKLFSFHLVHVLGLILFNGVFIKKIVFWFLSVFILNLDYVSLKIFFLLNVIIVFGHILIPYVATRPENLNFEQVYFIHKHF